MEESIIVTLVTVIFLLHAPSALVAILMLPIGILMALLAMRMIDLNANIMSLGGIAIAIGAMIDAAIAQPSDVDLAIEEGAVDRARPKMMTVTAIMAGLVPILWSQGAGADVMKRIAAPMVGGMISSTVLTLVVIPAIYSLWKEREVQRVVARTRVAGELDETAMLAANNL